MISVLQFISLIMWLIVASVILVFTMLCIIELLRGMKHKKNKSKGRTNIKRKHREGI